MTTFLAWLAAPGLLLLLAGVLTMRWARDPASANVGTIGAGIGVLMLAAHALGSLIN